MKIEECRNFNESRETDVRNKKRKKNAQKNFYNNLLNFRTLTIPHVRYFTNVYLACYFLCLIYNYYV